jgi:hypothetical protein
VCALERAGHDAEATAIARCTSLEDAVSEARRLAGQVAAARISLMMACDGGVRALGGAVSASAYIAAHAAQRLEGTDGYAVERDWQAQWLMRELGLRSV